MWSGHKMATGSRSAKGEPGQAETRVNQNRQYSKTIINIIKQHFLFLLVCGKLPDCICRPSQRPWFGGGKMKLTWQGQQGLEVSALSDSGTVLGTRVPKVLVLSVGDDHAAGERGNLPVVVRQSGASDQPGGNTQQEPGHLQRCRHFVPGKTLKSDKLTDKTGTWLYTEVKKWC